MKRSISIRAGSSYEDKEGVVIKAKEIYTHPKYFHVRDGYDAAIIELEKPLNYSKKIKAIPLATTEPVKGNVKTSGWGAIKVKYAYLTLFNYYLMAIYNNSMVP